VTRQHVGYHVDKQPVLYFLHRRIQTAVLSTVETVYKTLAPMEQYDLEFLIPVDSDTYIDFLNSFKLYVRGQMVSSSAKDVDLTDRTAVDNKHLHSLFSKCRVMVNGVLVTHSHEH
jgi:hypothetical protein